MKKLIRKILREEIDKSDKYYRRLDIISEHVQLPYFKSMEGLTIYEKDDQEYIMEKILGNDIRFEYDENGKVIFDGDSGGYDDNGNEIYYEDSEGYWNKWEYDDKGNIIYYENSDGYWSKYVYDEDGNKIYLENSEGYIRDNR